jgi:hypothetical protein
MKLQHECVLFGGREFVTVAEIPQLLADAVFTGDPDAEVAGQFGPAVRKQYAIDTEYPRALRDAISAGELVTRSSAGVAYAQNLGAMPHARVSVDDFARWAAQFGVRVLSEARKYGEQSEEKKAAGVPQKQSPDSAKSAPAGRPWVREAQEIGRELRKAHPRLNLDQLSKKVEDELKRRGSAKGRGGRVPKAGTIRRWACKGL